MAVSKNDLLPHALEDISTCVREDGNDGAHQGTLTAEEAEEFIGFHNTTARANIHRARAVKRSTASSSKTARKKMPNKASQRGPKNRRFEKLGSG